MSANLEADLVRIMRATPGLMAALEAARGLDLPDWRIVSGAVYQAVWNARTGRAPDHGIKDYDLVYFDGADISYEAEDAIIRRAASTLPAPLDRLVEVRNQARVHLWFEGRFGEPYEPLTSTDQALERFVAPAFGVGVRLEADDSISVAAPFGLEDVFSMTLRPNPRRPRAKGWDRAVANALARWPEATVVERV